MVNPMLSGIRLLLWFTLLTGMIYPLLVTLVGQVVFHEKANGSLIKVDEKILGSSLIGQKFTDDKYFWPRPSANNYDALASGGSNLGPTSAALQKTVHERFEHLTQAHSGAKAGNIPSELLYASGSGLEPYISSYAAYFQLDRVAKARGIDPKQVHDLVDRLAQGRFGIFGKRLVNVQQLNQALDSGEQ